MKNLLPFTLILISFVLSFINDSEHNKVLKIKTIYQQEYSKELLKQPLDSLHKIQVIKYDLNENPTKILKFGSDGSMLSYYNYKYDTNNNLMHWEWRSEFGRFGM